MTRMPASSYSTNAAAYPSGQRIFSGCEVLPVGSEPARIVWDDRPPGAGELRLRIAVAYDVREALRVEALTLGGKRVGEFVLSFSYVFQIHEIVVDADYWRDELVFGIVLRLVEGTAPCWIFWKGPGEGHGPHALSSEPTYPGLETIIRRGASLDSLQPFGWLEGCVMDGLLAWTDHRKLGVDCRRALDAHLAAFTGSERELRYEDPRNGPADGMVYGAEGGLPFAILARVAPGHPWLRLAADYFRCWTAGDASLHVAETSYTCAYPMAALAVSHPSDGWRELAIEHLAAQREILCSDNALWLRRSEDGARASFRNWSRGVAWYLLGLARALPLLGSPSELCDEFRRASGWAMGLQRADGLWSVYLDEPDLLPDTGACAGIAAALAIGARDGLLPDPAWRAAERCYAGLRPYLTPDGFLRGIAQSNKGGEALQRGPIRVMAQFGLGLFLLLAREMERGMAVD